VSAASPRVVALVPAWRAAAFIGPTLEALSAQTYPNLEILISDDASPDDTAAVCERFAERDPRVRVIRQPRNLGWVGNVNALLATARGDHLVFAFHDDLLLPAYVERCVAALAANPRAILAYSDVDLVHEDGRREERQLTELDGISDRLARALRVARQQGSWWIPNRGVFRAKAAAEIGGLRRHLGGEFSADWPWLLHMSLLGEFVRVPDRLCVKIYRAQSLSRQWRHGARSWSAVALSAMGAVSRAPLSASEKWKLHRALVTLAALRIRRSAARALRGLVATRRPEDATTLAPDSASAGSAEER
jgi:glycosyltransferase involved in cell wall biosynthesis